MRGTDFGDSVTAQRPTWFFRVEHIFSARQKRKKTDPSSRPLAHKIVTCQVRMRELLFDLSALGQLQFVSVVRLAQRLNENLALLISGRALGKHSRGREITF